VCAAGHRAGAVDHQQLRFAAGYRRAVIRELAARFVAVFQRMAVQVDGIAALAEIDADVPVGCVGCGEGNVLRQPDMRPRVVLQRGAQLGYRADLRYRICRQYRRRHQRKQHGDA